jgi:16S rRNA (cytosine967-C5)-methyltransferase
VDGQKPREIAVNVLLRRRNGAFIEHLLDSALANHQFSSADRSLCQELVFGVVRWQKTLDWLIARKTSNRIQKPLLQELLRLGLYQIFWLDRIPNHAAVNETVEIAKRGGMGPQSGFVNALLRGYLREFESTRQALAELKKKEPFIGYSHPDWLVSRWSERWGLENTLNLLEWDNRPPRNFARVNTLKIDAGKLIEEWRQENVVYDFVQRDWLEDNLVFELKSHPPLQQLTSFQRGLFYVQDPSTLLAVNSLSPKPGERLLDLCAAPGGKTTYIGQLVGNSAKIFAHDNHPARIKILEENCRRMGISAEVMEPATVESQAASSFDRVLVDAPCSNTGVIRRRVDVRWRINPAEIERLSKIQISLLRTAYRLLKPGGRLVYSTCSLELEENRNVIERFLNEQKGIRQDSERELLPFKDQADGAYVAVLKKE